MPVKIDSHDPKPWIALSLQPNFGSHHFTKWREECAQSLFPPTLPDASHPHWQEACAVEKQCRDLQIQIISWEDTSYPPLLRTSRAALPVLYARGSWNPPHAAALPIAMVGTRTPSWNGKAVAEALVESLQNHHTSIISGLAQGIDLCCHRTALAKQIHTVAVLGHGLDQEISGERGMTAVQILAQGGALLSPFPPGIPAWKGNFLARNAVIAGMSHAVVVVESRETGGALNTAEHCCAENRLLLAVPGDVLRPTSQGPNMLVESGSAKAIWVPRHFPGLCNLQAVPPDPTHALFKLLQGETCSLDEIMERSGHELVALRNILGELELEGLVKSVGGELFRFQTNSHR